MSWNRGRHRVTPRRAAAESFSSAGFTRGDSQPQLSTGWGLVPPAAHSSMARATLSSSSSRAASSPGPYQRGLRAACLPKGDMGLRRSSTH